VTYQTTDTTKKCRIHVFKILNTSYSWVQVVYETGSVHVLFSLCGSQQHGSTSHQKWLWKVWRSAVISSAVDGTEEDVLWNVRSECEEDEGTDCEDGDSDSNW